MRSNTERLSFHGYIFKPHQVLSRATLQPAGSCSNLQVRRIYKVTSRGCTQDSSPSRELTLSHLASTLRIADKVLPSARDERAQRQARLNPTTNHNEVQDIPISPPSRRAFESLTLKACFKRRRPGAHKPPGDTWLGTDPQSSASLRGIPMRGRVPSTLKLSRRFPSVRILFLGLCVFRSSPMHV